MQQRLLFNECSVGFTGAFQFSSELHSVRLYNSGDGLYIFVEAAQIIYLLFILYYMFLQVKTNMITTVLPVLLIACSFLSMCLLCLNLDI